MAAWTLIELDKPRRFRFDIGAAMRFEQDVGCGVNVLLEKRQNLLALVKLLTYGLKFDDPKITQTQVEGHLQVYVDAGGDIAALHSAVIDALNACGTFGKPESVSSGAGGPDGEGASDPPPPTPDA